MNFYPQLQSGATAQFPLTATRRVRTVGDETEDGRIVLGLDPAAGRIEWELNYRDLAMAEWETIDEFFEARAGRLGTFAFLDPMANLLAWSGDFSQTVWVKDPLLSVSAGYDDPSGGAAAWQLSNGGAAAQRLTQTVAAPGWFTTNWSVWARSNGASTVRLVRRAGAVEHTLQQTIGPVWRRVTFGGAPGGGGESTSFGIEVPAGGAVEVFGPQAEAQPAAGAYKMTGAIGGVYSNARFDMDELAGVSQGNGRMGTTVRISAPKVSR